MEALPAPALPEPVAVPEESFDTSSLAGAGEGALSAEELEKLGFGGGSPSVDTDLKVYGFADVNFALSPVPKDNPWRKANQTHSGFFVGNFNLYLSKNLSENVRTMSEVRFHYTPHGSLNTDGTSIESSAGDPADFGRAVHWGGIEIERIYVEWTIHPLIAVRVGQFLTPYGIWNVDHGSPIYIPPSRPYVIGSALFPERQTGAEFLGRWDASDDSTIGYHVTLSNGLGPISEIKDLDENKGVGGRVFWENRALGVLKIGGSIFYAKDTSTTNLSSLNSSGRLEYNERIDSQSKVLSMAADVQWRWKGLHAQAEVITQQRRFNENGRLATINPFTGQPLFPSDYTSWGAYGLLGYGYDVKGINLMPYLMVNSFDQLAPNYLRTKTNGMLIGFNVRPLDSLVVKLAYFYARWPVGQLVSDLPLHLVQWQVAWAF